MLALQINILGCFLVSKQQLHENPGLEDVREMGEMGTIKR